MTLLETFQNGNFITSGAVNIQTNDFDSGSSLQSFILSKTNAFRFNDKEQDIRIGKNIEVEFFDAKFHWSNTKHSARLFVPTDYGTGYEIEIFDSVEAARQAIEQEIAKGQMTIDECIRALVPFDLNAKEISVFIAKTAHDRFADPSRY